MGDDVDDEVDFIGDGSYVCGLLTLDETFPETKCRYYTVCNPMQYNVTSQLSAL